MHLVLDSGDQNGNQVSCNSDKVSSPDSMRSISSLSSSSRGSPADVEMLDCCLSKDPPAEHVTVDRMLTNEHLSPTPFLALHCGQKEGIAHLEFREKSKSVCLDTKSDNWNENLSLVQEHYGNPIGCRSAGSDGSADSSPDSAMTEGSEGPAVPGHRGSSDDGRDSTMSVSSGEMVMRKNSFSLNDSESDKSLSIFLIGESTGPASTPTEMGMLSVVLPDVHEGLQDKSQTGVADEDINSQRDVGYNHLDAARGHEAPKSVANKHPKTDPKRFPQPDFKNIKAKIMSRPTIPLKVPNFARVMPTPGKSAPAHLNTLVGPPIKAVQRKEESVDGNKRHRLSLSKNKGVVPKAGPRRVSECDSALKPKTHRDPTVVSLKREMPANGSSSINNITVTTVLTPPEHGHPKNTFQQDETPGSTSRCSSVSSKLAAASDGSKGRVGQRPSPGRGRGASSSQAPTANLRLPPPVAKLNLGTSSKDGRTSGSMSVSRTKHIPTAGNQKMRLTERPSVAAAIVAGTKPTLSPGLAGTRPAAGSKLPVKSQDQAESLKPSSLTGIHSEPGLATDGTRASAPAACKAESKATRPVASGAPAPRLLGKTAIPKAAGIRNRVQSPQGKGMTAGSKNAALPNQSPSMSVAGPLQRTGSVRFQRTGTASSVDKNKQKASPRTPQQQQQPQPQTNGQPELLPTERKPLGTEHYRAQCEKSNQCIQQLKKLLGSGNRRFEAIAVVIQHIVTERDEALKQHQNVSQELVTLRGELVTSATSCVNLEREKDELRVAFEGVLQKVQEQHQSDLADLEERLKTFYSTEWEKVHQAYQEEANKCKNQMQQQVEDLKSKHETLRKELEDSHAEKFESLKQQYETTFEELRKTHGEELGTLDKTLKEAEAKLSEQIKDLTVENNALNVKLKAEEDRRRMLAEKNLKDSHTLYLEQELESLKVVLDIKNKQLHQQDKKLMAIDKLMERNVKLDECLKKVQQENEDFRARMDKHAAVSRQLWTEQAVLQETLQKESIVNKRLSMENEELLWKLHNGDLSSPSKLSPTSPSKTFQSPCNTSFSSSAPVSPR
ncbi:hypothetical protein AAFF_G00357990 [Aldrovandia affinis]|uniref:Microtubule-associated tumor suppressor 1 n=1 Tax=Aldrovandia affinis TaxID=143900 RepID=A0AAD7TAC7_9TELE|nr:hypothetical protein AAFF_G00357990 [Aldrovandia affinis]